MACFFTTIVFLAPRAGILIWWLVDTARWDAAFNSFIWPLLGFIFLPWATLMFVFIASDGVTGFDWILLALAILVDIGMYAGMGFGNQNNVRRYNK